VLLLLLLMMMMMICGLPAHGSARLASQAIDKGDSSTGKPRRAAQAQHTSERANRDKERHDKMHTLKYL
jgi:hypothetical protein